MAAAEQIKSLIKSFADGDDSHFYATAMQIAAAEARNGNTSLAEELKKTIDKAKLAKAKSQVLLRTMPVNAAQKELTDLLELSIPHVHLQDMILQADIGISLQRVVDEQHKAELLHQHNMLPRKKLLLVGPPGCGKTMAASALAAELGLSLFVIRLDGLISRYMGESIAKLRLIFDAMKQFKAVYLFDEFDSIGVTRTEANDVGEIKRVLNSFLLQIEKDESDSLIIAATNLPHMLDNALLRRFDDIIKFSLPGSSQIENAFKSGLGNVKGFNKLNLSIAAEMATGLSYADIYRICSDIVKEGIIYGEDSITTKKITHYIQLRKHPF